MAVTELSRAYHEKMILPPVRSQKDLIGLVKKYGFLPFFSGPIPGFNVYEAVPDAIWETNKGLGPWMWRDEIAREGSCIYGKFLGGKTAYVSREWFAHLANYRRDGYDFDARYDDGLARFEDKQVYDLILNNGPISAPALRAAVGVERGKSTRFEASMTRLQMMTYVVPCDFIFPRDAHGEKKFSYGVTVYDVAERALGTDAVSGEYDTAPEESFELIMEHLRSLLPEADEKCIQKLIRI